MSPSQNLAHQFVRFDITTNCNIPTRGFPIIKNDQSCYNGYYRKDSFEVVENAIMEVTVV